MAASQQQVFERFESYDFENDSTFQSGLKSIVSNNQNKSEKEQRDAIENAKYFYFTRFVQSFDYNQYKAWRAQKSTNAGASSEESKMASSESDTTSMAVESQSSDPASAATSADPTYPKSFQEICELIAAGKPIPGIRQIPNNLAEGTPSEAKLAPKPKPWEQKKAAAAVATTASTTDTSATTAPESTQESTA
ncbi:hypothetical protein BC939DRAFT_451709 [Gamsiella multidivaricata]|uniref:uncharacterized protein n=1 Tax=Gamsiella multidivaricata TaxID=101098 RepID=UPI002220D50C|nr:uncharacterized protein BC939DRAFT_451709 [Gamsiella multidivaricata]KAI7823323.1 hypothetical protein BC939DRAFT_451709 [Gamsiella multidivaricata]